MALFDIHSHILPGVDDGAKTVEDSIKLLEIQKAQGVDGVMLTPHFYPTEDSIEDFSERVRQAWALLSYEIRGMDLPRCFIGCEVLFFSGLGRADGIENLCLANSDYMLIEFPFMEFSQRALDELVNLREERDIIPIIAHIERYCDFKGYKNLLKLVKRGTVLSQVNASALADKKAQKVPLKLIKEGCVTFIGSDTHSLLNRPPQIKQALETVLTRCGREERNRLVQNSQEFFEEMKANQI